MGRKHAQNDRDSGNAFRAYLDTDEPAELKYNATPEPLRGLADKLMEQQDIAPVPDYDLVIEGSDAADVVHNRLAAVEIEARLDDDADRRRQRVRISPRDFILDYEQKAFRLRNPVPLEHLVKGAGQHGEPWPDNYSIGVRLIDIDGEYITPRWADA